MIYAEVVLKDQTEQFFQLQEHAAVERIVIQLVSILKAESPDSSPISWHAADEFFLLDAFTNRKLDPKKTLADQKIDSGCRLRLLPAREDHSGRNDGA